MTTRRSFLAGAVATAAITRSPTRMWSQAARGASGLTLSINPKRISTTMPRDFSGLSYESAQLGHPDFFSAANTALIGLFQRLSPEGVLRIGGNTEEYTTWTSDDTGSEKNQTPHAIGPDAGSAAKTASILTPASIRNLNDFIVKVGGWRIIYGLNLWHGTPENAAAEAAYVFQVLGPRLICFQIGNEPDMDHDSGSKERWTFDHYWERWQTFVTAVRKAVPKARFAGPDIAKEYDWITKMAEKGPDIEFLTGHYYAEGPPANPKMTLEFLLKRGRDPATEEFGIVHAATRKLGKPYRMSEGNSCFHGGKPLVSDTLASALWGGDYMLQLAQAGYMGVNLHGGGNGLYTPIGGDTTPGFTARPLYYGMLLAGCFAGCTFVECNLSKQDDEQNVTAFAAKDPSHRWKLAIFNKAGAPATLTLSGLAGAKSGSIQWLQGPSIDSHTGITFGASSVDAAGAFAPRKQANLKIIGGRAVLEIPAYTAAYIES